MNAAAVAEGDVKARAVRDAQGWLQNLGRIEKLRSGYNNGSFASGATPGNIQMQASHVSVFDTTTVNANSKGFRGAVFDGRYIYFVPLETGPFPGHLSGQVTRYDTTGSFTNTGSWSVFDTTAVDANSKGFIGGVFDGRYLYLVPNNNGAVFGQVTRYDTTGSFTAAASWSVYDTTAVNTNSKGFSGAVFDGRYVYLIPLHNGTTYSGQVTRYDTTGNFTAAGSWSVYDTTAVSTRSRGFRGGIFDGRYVYLIQYVDGSQFSGQFTRYDTTGSFTDAASWSVFDAQTVSSNAAGFPGGAAFDGRYLYFAPYNVGASVVSGEVLRYDTTASFTAAGSWSVYDTTAISANSRGFSSAVFDGRYVYFVPNYNGSSNHGQVTRYDSTGSFYAAGSWSTFDLTTVNVDAVGFYGGIFDGRYVYFVPDVLTFTPATSNGHVARLKAWAGGVDSTPGIARLARSSEFYIDSASNVGIGTTAPVSGGGLTIAPAARTSGNPSVLTVTRPAHTTLAAGTEAVDVMFDLSRTVQFATGALTTQRAALFKAPTYSFVQGSTITNAATVAITGAPSAGENATITNPYSLWVQGGKIRADGLPQTQVNTGGKPILFLEDGNLIAQTYNNLLSYDSYNGRLGSGITSPSYQFHMRAIGGIAGGGQLVVDSTNSAGQPTVTVANDTGKSIQLYAAGSGTGGTYGTTGISYSNLIALISSGPAFIIDSNNNPMVFATGSGGNERMRIASSGEVGIGTNSPNSLLSVNGPIATAFATKTSSYTASASDSVIACDATSAAVTINLPSASGITGRHYTIKKIDSSSNSCTIGPNGSETVDGGTTYALGAQWKYVTVVSNGSNWLIVANN